jgi:hypothetical protein
LTPATFSAAATGRARRIEVEQRFAPKKVEIQEVRFEVNLGKDAIIKFLNVATLGFARLCYLALVALDSDSPTAAPEERMLISLRNSSAPRPCLACPVSDCYGLSKGGTRRF